MVIVQQLRKQLPAGYTAEPRVRLGTAIEIDMGAFEHNEPAASSGSSPGHGGVAMAVRAVAEPSLAVDTELPDQYEYEVRIFDATADRQLVAAIEFVSPANKDRPENRNLFIAKCAALLQQGVAISIVDLVTVRHFNLYVDLLALIGKVDATMGNPAPPIYAASCRWVRPKLQCWSHALSIGALLPTLPLWLSADLHVPLDLESSYEQACHDLWIA